MGAHRVPVNICLVVYLSARLSKEQPGLCLSQVSLKGFLAVLRRVEETGRIENRRSEVKTQGKGVGGGVLACGDRRKQMRNKVLDLSLRLIGL